MELNAIPQDTTADRIIIDSNQDSFMQDVVESSMEQPVIVDFWAPWCGPCKTLGPQLEEAVKKQNGKVKMVKINVDENQAIAAQLNVQSIPTVYAFSQGRPIDAFQGAQSPSQTNRFVEKLAQDAPNSPIEDALEQADALVEAGELEAAAQYYSAILAQDLQNPRAIIGLASLLIDQGQMEEAKELFDRLSPEDEAKAEPLISRIQMLESAVDAGPIDELFSQVESNPEDHQARIDLASALFAECRNEEAVSQLLTSFKMDREWNDGAAKAKLIELFDAMDPKDPALSKGRRQFSSLVFA